jgi:hypothetical protein
MISHQPQQQLPQISFVNDDEEDQTPVYHQMPVRVVKDPRIRNIQKDHFSPFFNKMQLRLGSNGNSPFNFKSSPLENFESFWNN